MSKPTEASHFRAIHYKLDLHNKLLAELIEVLKQKQRQGNGLRSLGKLLTKERGKLAQLFHVE